MNHETFKLYREHQIHRSNKRRRHDAKRFARAVEIAQEFGLLLLQHTEVHYSLRAPDWILHLYPGNQRLYADPGKSRKPPYVRLSRWTLVDAVRAFGVAHREREAKQAS